MTDLEFSLFSPPLFFLSVSYREADLERSPSRILDKRVLYPLHGEYLKMCFRASVG